MQITATPRRAAGSLLHLLMLHTIPRPALTYVKSPAQNALGIRM
jgi:hypothetical protein